jgi:hypothetical protein
VELLQRAGSAATRGVGRFFMLSAKEKRAVAALVH